MTIPSFTGTVPNRSQPQDEFNANTQGFLAWMEGLPGEINSAISQINASAAVTVYADDKIYSFPDTVNAEDGVTYRCKGTSIQGKNPAGGAFPLLWVALTLKASDIVSPSEFKKELTGAAFTLTDDKGGLELSGMVQLMVAGNYYALKQGVTIDLNAGASWDDASYSVLANRAGKDLYIYALGNGELLLSANATVPTGHTAENSRKVGGFHGLCKDVGVISGHPLSGLLTGQPLPTSLWDIKHRPLCRPEGMVYSDHLGLWVDVYLQSGTGVGAESAFEGTITDTRDWMDFTDDLAAVSKRMLRDREFQIIAEGSNQETNITGSADPVKTGGHIDTAGRRMISDIGAEDCCGALWQWLDAGGNESGSGWTSLAGNKGDFYGTASVKLLAGGVWDNGASCGSRARHAYAYRWYASSSIGSRGCALSQGV